ncbi:SGNH/GDSL hydrolase family protein [Flammeovirga sp. EKP202]|uniref:SGNH/GDSL hydrolase family protein n=1 Tax=Flammeovirga sp. EKP202 TaxID=2770592 RepID=UPI00165F5558|nr:SGNH/GDSL hydrolase family protein [Flammeovirga sp. EKP202]MBD0400249.1 SGNH/GDSL hydrolase family protein [Flammeovirga sp. EKP202]
MKQYILVFLFTILNVVHVFSQDFFTIDESIKRVVFLGNSITYSGSYISYFETYFRLNYPDRNIEFINVGLPSETVSGLSEEGHADGAFPRPDLHERLQRVLDQLKPDLVFACYGMNDGIYKPYDDHRFAKYKEGMEWLHQEVIKSGADIIHLTPAIYDPIKGEAYSKVLDLYADWMLSQQYTVNWKVIDIHFPMKKYLEEGRAKDPQFLLANDGVHPNQEGHWVMALPLIKKYNLLHQKNTIVPYQEPYGLLKIAKVFTLVDQRQKIMKDAWLNQIGHLRPRMKKGLSIEKANKKARKIQVEIDQELLPLK